jgi:hypothetical protein
MPRLRGRRNTIRLAAHLLFAVAAALAGATAAAAQQPAGCAGFMASMTQSLADQHAQFEHPLVVSRNTPAFGAEVYDLTTDVQVEGTLRCRGDHLVRFEAKIDVPADAKLLHSFDQVLQASLLAAMKWPPPRVATTLHELNDEAAEYLRASIERGDVFLAGKTESHEGGSDLGMIWTKTDRTFIIVGSE